jgi:hypothetical protein
VYRMLGVLTQCERLLYSGMYACGMDKYEV